MLKLFNREVQTVGLYKKAVYYIYIYIYIRKDLQYRERRIGEGFKGTPSLPVIAAKRWQRIKIERKGEKKMKRITKKIVSMLTAAAICSTFGGLSSNLCKFFLHKSIFLQK